MGKKLSPNDVNRALYNSPIGMFTRVGAPTYTELQLFRLYNFKFRMAFNKVFTRN